MLFQPSVSGSGEVQGVQHTPESITSTEQAPTKTVAITVSEGNFSFCMLYCNIWTSHGTS